MIQIFSNLRRYGRLIKALDGYIYDFKRYHKQSSWKGDLKNKNPRNYHSVKIYHALEKSLSFKNRKKDSGWDNAFLLLNLLKKAEENNNVGYHDRAGLSTLIRFIEENPHSANAERIKQEIKNLNFFSADEHGIKTFTSNDFLKGKLKNPENFFLSRFSLREFKPELVSENLIERAVKLAMKTPSACNRQAWHIYHTADQNVKNRALKFQTGNRGFGENIPNLVIITADQQAFMPGQERYQHWIDGGMFAMSFIYSLHSLGIASCCLNWSQSPKMDKLLRANVNIQPNHSVIMMLAIGFPDEENNVCLSARRPLNEIFTNLTTIN
ncbi:nitroreductase family protein [Gramella sp. MT6]|uniref:nitroreductase family protein n=1 Tax=Gramella sp. MT6 TaxID=2705471 RepID=UPI001C6004EF|nr:nitroreductase family protein [Gramella sp. MT6]QYA24393.1 nitroreductase family protein [Gramella sp. MT6]